MASSLLLAAAGSRRSMPALLECFNEQRALYLCFFWCMATSKSGKVTVRADVQV
jgi:hypothetical protein